MTDQSRAAHQPIEPTSAESGNRDADAVAASPTRGMDMALRSWVDTSIAAPSMEDLAVESDSWQARGGLRV